MIQIEYKYNCIKMVLYENKGLRRAQTDTTATR